MWTRFIPAVARARELIHGGVIGELRMVHADFGFRTAWEPESRLLNPALAGGALLDVGIYVLSLSSMVLGPHPSNVTATAHLGKTGVDEQAAILLHYDGGKLAVLSCAVRTRTAVEATFYGTNGWIRLHSPFFHSAGLTVQSGENQEQIKLPVLGNGYHYQAIEVMRCLHAGETESPTMPLEESLALMNLMDRIRAQWGLRYPME